MLLLSQLLLCCSTREGGGALLSKKSTDVETTLISDKENTRFEVKRTDDPDYVDVGIAKIVKVKLDPRTSVSVRAKAPGYRLKEFHLQSPTRQVQFFFLLEDRLLTIISSRDDTKFRIRRTGSSRWQDIRETGKRIEYPIPLEGSFELEASSRGYFPIIMPVIDPTGELVFGDFVQSSGMELVSNQDSTRFLIRKLGQGDTEWEYLGVGRSLPISAPTIGSFEIQAEPLYHRPKSITLSRPQERVTFDFAEADRISLTPPTPESGPQRTAITPRRVSMIGKLSGEDRIRTTSQETWRGLLIGISDYSGSGGKCSNLVTPNADVAALGNLLKNNYGFRSVQTLIDREASLDRIRNGLFSIHTTAQPDENILIYYAGHGVLAPNGAGQWICADGREMVNAEIKDCLYRFRARRVLLVSDSCFSGEFLTRDLVVRIEAMPSQDKSEEISRAIVLNRNPSRQVLTSGQLAPVPDKGSGFCSDHSPFACHLLDALKGVPVGGALGTIDLHTAIISAMRRQGTPADRLPQLGSLDGDSGGEFFLLRIE